MQRAVYHIHLSLNAATLNSPFSRVSFDKTSRRIKIKFIISAKNRVYIKSPADSAKIQIQKCNNLLPYLYVSGKCRVSSYTNRAWPGDASDLGVNYKI